MLLDLAKYLITEQNMQGKGVSAQSNPMELPEAEAKAVFDQLVKEVVVPKFNELLEALEPIDLTSDEEKPVSTAAQAALDLKIDKEKKTGSTTENKVLSDNNYSDGEQKKVAEAELARHTHGNKAVLDGISSQDLVDWRGGNVLTKDNVVPYVPTGQYNPVTKDYVDKNYSSTEKGKVAEVYDKRHTHGNKAVLDGITGQDLTDWRGGNVLTKDNAVAYEPTGQYHPATKDYVDKNYSSTEKAKVAEVYDKRHTHGNKAVLDGITGQDLVDWRGGKVLTKDNTTPYEPAGQYNPATKDYVDKNYSSTEKAKVAQAYEKMHTHGNKAALDGITAQDLTDWRGGNVLTKNNATPFTPSGPYQPATMKYVDEKVVSIGGADMTKVIYDPNNKSQDIFAYADNTRIMTDTSSGKRYILGVNGNGLFYKEVL